MLIQLAIPVIVEDSQNIRNTLKAFSHAQNKISKDCFNKGDPLSAFELHKTSYRKLKHLNAQMKCTAVRLTAGAYCSAKRNEHEITKPFNFKTPHALWLIGKRGRDASFKKDKLSLWTTKGRKNFIFTIPEKFKERFFTAISFDSINIVEHKGKLIAHLALTVEAPDPKGILPVGIDRNATNIIVATDTNNRVFFEDGVTHRIKNTKLRKVRKRLNAKLVAKKAEGKNTHSIVRLFKRLSHKQNNRTKTYAQTIAKRLINWCEPNSVIVMEELDVPQPKRALNYKVRTGTRRKLSQWFQGAVGKAIENKASQAGIGVVYVSPYNTSQNCSRCGLKGVRNRHNFNCPSCGFVSHADTNAAVNIRNRYTALRGSGLPSNSPEASSRGKPPNSLGGF